MSLRVALSLLGILSWTAVVHAEEPYGWTLSASSTDPFVNVAPAKPGVATFYLWFVCSELPENQDRSDRVQGITGAEFSLVADGITILATTPVCGVGTPAPAPDFVTRCPECITVPTLVASLLVINQPGSICFGPSLSNGVMQAMDCEANPRTWGIDWIGISTDGSDPCRSGSLCQRPVAVDDFSWGRVKLKYR